VALAPSTPGEPDPAGLAGETYKATADES
jgi:hypothetical protein